MTPVREGNYFVMSRAFIVRNLLSGLFRRGLYKKGIEQVKDEKLGGFRTDRVTLQHSLPITIDQAKIGLFT